MKTVCFCAVLLWAFVVGVSDGFAKSRPNIVVFLVDDLGARDLGCFGSSFYETPNVDRLASQGMRFTAAYAACPVCSPTRAALMTGRYPQRTGITDYINPRGVNQPAKWRRNTPLLPARYSDRLALEELTMAEALREAGYATFFAGKWHLGGAGYLPTDQGFNVNRGGFSGGSPRTYFSPYGNPQLQDEAEGEPLPIRLAEETCQFIEEHHEGPFFAYLSFYSVHIPLQARSELIEKYEAKAARLPKAEPAWGEDHNGKVRLRQNHPTYAGMIEEMDRACGKVLDKLDELGLTDNTLVLFTSDNGGLSTAEGSPTSNVPLRAGKGWLYEGGIRVPMIARWPGVAAAASTCTEPVISNDFFPTLLDAAGRPPSTNGPVDGVSLVPVLKGGQLDSRPLFWHYPHYGNQGGMPGSAIREGRWKLIEWHEDRPAELYDLESDPSESKNVADEHSAVVERLRDTLAAWKSDVGAKMPTPNPRYRQPGAR